MIHIVFNEEEVKLMKEVIAADETLAGEVIQETLQVVWVWSLVKPFL